MMDLNYSSRAKVLFSLLSLATLIQLSAEFLSLDIYNPYISTQPTMSQEVNLSFTVSSLHN